MKLYRNNETNNKIIDSNRNNLFFESESGYHKVKQKFILKYEKHVINKMFLETIRSLFYFCTIHYYNVEESIIIWLVKNVIVILKFHTLRNSEYVY